MANAFSDILVTTEPIHALAPSFSATEGAVVEFFGVVRGTEAGAAGEANVEISGIDYEAHVPMAERQLQKIADEALELFGFQSLILHHRIGWVPVAEPSLWVRLTARHRAEAFASCQWIIDRLKERVPIWKGPQPVVASESRSDPSR